MSQAEVSYWPRHGDGGPRDVTVGDLLREACAAAPDRVALVEESAGGDRPASTWTYAELLEEATRAARALAAHFTPGERVAVWAPNSGRWVVLQQALALAGLVVVPLNPAYRGRELAYALTQSGAAGLFHADEHRGFAMASLAREVAADCPDLRLTVCLSDWADFVGAGPDDVTLPEVDPRAPWAILYTSGTTGQPKGALLHHTGVVNQADLVAQRADLGDGGVWVNAMPLYHMAGTGVTALGVISRRGTHVVMPEFDAGEVLRVLEAHGGTHALLVPTMLIAILDHPDLGTRRLDSVRTVMSGASAVPVELVARTTEALGCRFSILFGQAETHGVITQTSVDDDVADQATTIGRPLPWIEVQIDDTTTGGPVAVGEQGEICCRGYQTMIEYFRMPEATSATIDDDGWLHTGDLGTMDERGFVRITGRLKEMIIRGGLNIYPREVEEVLFGHPAVADVAVVGVPHPTWGEQVAAVVRLQADAARPAPADLKEFCASRLARFKTPEAWYVVDDYPLTPTGKVQKFALAEMIASGTLAAGVLEPR